MMSGYQQLDFEPALTDSQDSGHQMKPEKTWVAESSASLSNTRAQIAKGHQIC